MLSTHGASFLCAGLWASPSGVTFGDEDLGKPDFADPATLGCLLAAVRGAWDCHAIHTQGRLHQFGEGWWHDKSQRQPTWRWSTVIPGWPNTSGPTEADALIAALEAAAARRGGQP
jgi:hypothetical protein